MTRRHHVTTVQRPTGYRVLVDGRPVGLVGRGSGDSKMVGISWYGVAFDGTRHQAQGRGTAGNHLTPGQAVRWVAKHYLERSAP
jgi:hypothetical protein